MSPASFMPLYIGIATEERTGYMARFAAKGLKDYGYYKTAEGILGTILSWVEHDGEYIHENYNSITGEGLYNPKFSWSAVFVIEFILNF